MPRPTTCRPYQGPLLDRMEIIEVSSYTENEKWHIGREHLVPKQMKIHGLKEGQLILDDEALREMITGYTKEAGVRELERKIGEICRKTARKILEDKQESVTVNPENLEEFLGRAKYTYQKRTALMRSESSEGWPGPVWEVIPCRSR